MVIVDILIFVKGPDIKVMIFSMLTYVCYIGYVLGIDVDSIVHLLNEIQLNGATVIYVFLEGIGELHITQIFPSLLHDLKVGIMDE